MNNFYCDKDFIYCFSCFGITGVIDNVALNISESDNFIRDLTGRVISKTICPNCIEKIKNSDLATQVIVENQFQSEDEKLPYAHKKANIGIDDILKNFDRKILILPKRRKKGENK